MIIAKMWLTEEVLKFNPCKMDLLPVILILFAIAAVLSVIRNALRLKSR